MLPIIHMVRGHKEQKAGDRRPNGVDRQASDHEKGLFKPKDGTARAVIGPIGPIGKFRVYR